MEADGRVVLYSRIQRAKQVSEMFPVRQIGQRIMQGRVLKIFFALTQSVRHLLLFQRKS